MSSKHLDVSGTFNQVSDRRQSIGFAEIGFWFSIQLCRVSRREGNGDGQRNRHRLKWKFFPLLLFIKCISNIFKKYFALAYHFSPALLRWGHLLIKHCIIFLWRWITINAALCCESFLQQVFQVQHFWSFSVRWETAEADGVGQWQRKRNCGSRIALGLPTWHVV